MAETLDLAPLPTPPDLPGTVVVRDDVDALIDAAAADLLIHAFNCVRAFGDFHIALSGGSTPEPLYRRLMYDPRYRELPWKRTHLWVVDERRVPFDDERSNFKLISELLGEHAGIPPEQVHPIFAMSETADADYERLLQQTLAWREPGQDRLDYVLLGMGADGHTASIFPRSPALEAWRSGGRIAERLVLINEGPTVAPPGRVTMTYRLINASRFVSIMVTGESKRETVERVARSRYDEDAFEDLPVLGVHPVAGELRWYLDAGACPEPARAG